MLSHCAMGFGAAALAALLGEPRSAFADDASRTDALTPKPTHFPAKAKNVIFLYMDGGVSHVDSFDPKPLLTQENGKPFKMKMEPTQFNNNGNTLGSPWKFKQYGQCGHWISELFPFTAESADELCVIRSMTSNFSEHTGANYFLHTGNGQQGRPSMGAWMGYGLGSENRNLPGFVVLNGGLIPVGGLDNFNSGFLPASYQGSIFKPDAQPVANIKPAETREGLQRKKLDLMKKLDAPLLEESGHDDALESAVANYELAFKMQTAVPELMDIAGESEATKKLYGLDAQYPQTRIFAKQCLLARRLVERGVRFIELTCPATPNDRWDQHSGLKKGHEENSRAVDQPIGGLLKDLKARGLLASTLVVFTGEFGRTPFAQGSDGRDHNPFGFSLWMAGGGVKAGSVYGATDEYGYKAVEKKLEIHDLHATMLHLLGMEHTRLTYRWGGRDMRLTDVFGNVIKDIVA
ncbi:MAG TPA: DUF1501 domain-containing protein [Planctomycetota bacterium]|nr:DUF1501 domain-containing protein [Planctomycetota bacterium]